MQQAITLFEEEGTLENVLRNVSIQRQKHYLDSSPSPCCSRRRKLVNLPSTDEEGTLIPGLRDSLLTSSILLNAVISTLEYTETIIDRKGVLLLYWLSSVID